MTARMGSAIGCVGLVVGLLTMNVQAAPPETQVKDGMDVGINYTLTIDGKVVDSTQGGDPFHYVHGRKQIIAGLERAMTGLKVGDERDIVLKPEEAYGNVKPQLIMEVTKSSLPQGIQPAPGVVFRYADEQGHSIRALIKEVKENTVVLDGNPPFAGKTVSFHITVVDVKPAVAS